MSTPASASTWSPYSATPTNCSTQQSATVTAVALFLYLGPHPYAARADLRGLPLGGAGPQKSLPHRRNTQSGPWSITYPEYLSGWAALRIGGNGKRPNHSRAHAETAGLGPQRKRRSPERGPAAPQQRVGCSGWAALRIGEMESGPSGSPAEGNKKGRAANGNKGLGAKGGCR